MIKIKEKTKKDKTYIISKINSKDIVNEGEVKVLTSTPIKGLLPLVFNSKHHSKTFAFDVTNLTSLKIFLNQPQTKESFLKIIENIVKVMRNCESHNMNIQKLYLDINNIYVVNYETKELKFVYLPVENYENDALSFLSSVSSNAKLPDGKDIEYFIDFRKYCESLHYFSLPDLERKIQLIADGISEDEKKKLHKGSHFSGKMIFDPFGGSFSDNKNYEEEYDNTRCFCSNCNLEYPKGTKFCAECGENLTPIKGLTLSAKKEDKYPSEPPKRNSKRVTGLMPSKKVNYPSLLRLSNNDIIDIDKSKFSVGYNSDCDFSFQDNEHISGRHCVFYYSDGEVFVMDEKSTNGTYINGEEISYGKKVKLNFGDKITLADEEFILKGID